MKINVKAHRNFMDDKSDTNYAAEISIEVNDDKFDKDDFSDIICELSSYVELLVDDSMDFIDDDWDDDDDGDFDNNMTPLDPSGNSFNRN